MFEFKSIARPRGSSIPLARNYLHVWVILCQINEKRRDASPSIHSLQVAEANHNHSNERMLFHGMWLLCSNFLITVTFFLALRVNHHQTILLSFRFGIYQRYSTKGIRWTSCLHWRDVWSRWKCFIETTTRLWHKAFQTFSDAVLKINKKIKV